MKSLKKMQKQKSIILAVLNMERMTVTSVTRTLKVYKFCVNTFSFTIKCTMSKHRNSTLKQEDLVVCNKPIVAGLVVVL